MSITTDRIRYGLRLLWRDSRVNRVHDQASTVLKRKQPSTWTRTAPKARNFLAQTRQGWVGPQATEPCKGGTHLSVLWSNAINEASRNTALRARLSLNSRQPLRVWAKRCRAFGAPCIDVLFTQVPLTRKFGEVCLTSFSECGIVKPLSHDIERNSQNLCNAAESLGRTKAHANPCHRNCFHPLIFIDCMIFNLNFCKQLQVCGISYLSSSCNSGTWIRVLR